VWGTRVNPECKLLVLWHAFEHCGFGRVKLRTDSINTRSQAAIAKLGATREGIARRHLKRADGTWRDSVIYSVIIDDWPQVKAGLEQRLATLSGLSGPASDDVSRAP
jgi:RimJ/RimL family protein N-acetyltransferase